MQSIENKVINRIYGKGRGWAFSKIDFIDIGSAAAVEQSLSRLTKKGRIRRVIRGLYDYPKDSQLLKKQLGPEIDQVAQALARKFSWTIQVSGNTALNILGLSTQVPGRYLYLSDGKSAVYHIGKQELAFKKTSLKEAGLNYPESSLVVQAIKSLGRGKIGFKERTKIKEHFDQRTAKRILKDTRYSTSWIYEEIKAIFQEQ